MDFPLVSQLFSNEFRLGPLFSDNLFKLLSTTLVSEDTNEKIVIFMYNLPEEQNKKRKKRREKAMRMQKTAASQFFHTHLPIHPHKSTLNFSENYILLTSMLHPAEPACSFLLPLTKVPIIKWKFYFEIYCEMLAFYKILN